MNLEIALVEDEKTIAANYKDALQRVGYRVTLYSNRSEAIAAFKQRLPDLAIIDVGLEDEYEGGFDLCRELRAMAPQLPIVFLTARDSELDEIIGLKLGADDYLTKHISLNQMMARISALLRRVNALRNNQPAQEETLKRGALEINKSRFTVAWQNQLLELTLTEYWIVHALAQHPGQIKSREQLMQAAQVVQDDHTITTHIKRIRRKFKALDPDFNQINTAYGLGYRWHANG